MEYPLKREKIAEGVYFNSIIDKRFKTNRISVNLFLKLDKETATAYAVLPFLLRKGCATCPDFTELNKKLMGLYGAFLGADVRKIGDSQVLNLSISCLDDAYALEQEPLTQQASSILADILLKPAFVEGKFKEDDLKVEKQNLTDLIQSEINDKRSYAIGRLTELMCADEPYGINKYGSIEQAEKLDAEAVTAAYQKMLQTADIQIMYVGSGDHRIALNAFREAFAGVSRENVYQPDTTAGNEVGEVREHTDTFQVAQSKLVLGFRTGSTPQDDHGMRLMTALFGGTPFSKLFLNVRERLSLCYYCAARLDRIKGIVLVDCGVETENIEKAREEILAQLTSLQNGEFTDEELENTKLSLINSMKTVGDSPSYVEVWYLSQICYNTQNTPQNEIDLENKVTRDEVIAAAKQVKLDTVYVLTGKQEEGKGDE
ncbi:MAG: insulinase family protein [Massilioclostridium sp.]|nr:insulinase family protein [Massilioclostridium sp.]